MKHCQDVIDFVIFKLDNILKLEALPAPYNKSGIKIIKVASK